MRLVGFVAVLEAEQTIGVKDGVGLLALPLSVQRDIGLHGSLEVVCLGKPLVGIPALKVITASRGSCRGLGLRAIPNLLGGHGAAAVRIEGNLDLVRLPLSIQRDIGLDLRIEVKGSLASFVGVPALERMARLSRVCGLGHLTARFDRLRLDSRPAIGIKRNRALSNGGYLNLARKDVSHKHGEHLRRLRTRCSALRFQAKLAISIVHATHDACSSGPLQRFDGKRGHRSMVDRCIELGGIRIRYVNALSLGETPDHRCQLLARNSAIGAEASFVGAGGVSRHHACRNTPGNGLVIPASLDRVGKLGAALRRTSRRTPQDRGNLGARKLSIGVEVSRIATQVVFETRHETIGGRILHPRLIPCTSRNVFKGCGCRSRGNFNVKPVRVPKC